MVYTLEQLKDLILPIIKSMPYEIKIEGEANIKTVSVKPLDEERVADALVEIIKQDREAHGVK